jgi:NAD(P)-dependent dehydrogenase (short-subunit alcohol dehydrogenase family)
MSIPRSSGIAIVTGASGGMGRACARQLGAAMNLVLTDASPKLEDFAAELETEGCTILGAIVGDFRSENVRTELKRHASHGFSALAHTAGLPPSAPWREVMEVNFVATARLLDVLEPHVGPGTAAVLVASVAGHLPPIVPDIEAALAQPFASDFLDILEPLLTRELGAAAQDELGTLSYAYSKKKVIDLCEGRAAAWGASGGRIVSLSPGMIYTPMGRREAELDAASEAQVKSAPAGRWGTTAEIAATVCFLLGPTAPFITGTDLRIDGGAVGALRASNAPPWIEMLRARRG